MGVISSLKNGEVWANNIGLEFDGKSSKMIMWIGEDIPREILIGSGQMVERGHRGLSLKDARGKEGRELRTGAKNEFIGCWR
jgi:hypothetical protein